MSEPDTKTADLYAHCKDCDHQWVAATAPMEATAFIKKVRESETCPQCDSKQVMCGWSKKE